MERALEQPRPARQLTCSKPALHHCPVVRLELSAVCVFRLRHNKIASVREYFDQASYERQLASSVR